MATLLGSTVKPTYGQAWYGASSENQLGMQLTLPGGGPWRITEVGLWFAGKDAAVGPCYLCVWDTLGNVLGESISFSTAGYAFAPGNSDLNQRVLVSPPVVNGGTTVIVGLARDLADAHQYGFNATGVHSHYQETGALPGTLTGGGDNAGSIGAFLYYELANSAPAAPTGLSPTGNAIVHTGRTITYQGTRSDPDAGDYLTAVQILLHNDSSVQIDDWTTNLTGTPTSFSIARTLPGGYNANAFYRWKARTKDSAGAWGPYSALQRFKANTLPSTPSAPTVPTNSLTPSISGGFSDVDPGDSLAAIQIIVQLNASPNTQYWDSGEVAKSGSTWAQTYAGTALAWGTAYRAKARTKDANGGWSAYSGWRVFTPVQPTGPDNCSPTSTATKQNSLTPTLTVGHSANFRNEQIEVRTTPGGGTLMWSKVWDGSDYAATLTKARVYAGSALAWGTTYYWRAQVELDPSGTISGWTDWFPFYINAQPTAPTVSIANGDGSPAVISATGVRVVTDSTPDLTCPFADPDKAPYGDAPSARRIEIRRKSDQVALSGYPLTTGTTETHTVATALTLNTEYEVRWGYRDNAGEPAGTYVFSAWLTIKYSVLPVAAIVDEAAVTITNPSLASNDIVLTTTPHGYAAGNQVRFTALTGGAGLVVGTVYYVIAANLGASQFQVSLSAGGVAVDFTTNITAGSVVRQIGPISPLADSTPTLDWTFTGSGGKTQYSHQVKVFDKGPVGANYPDEAVVYDSGEIISATSELALPVGVLTDDHDYRWSVTVKDTDLLSYTLA